jgi:hypothetical protein
MLAPPILLFCYLVDVVDSSRRCVYAYISGYPLLLASAQGLVRPSLAQTDNTILYSTSHMHACQGETTTSYILSSDKHAYSGAAGTTYVVQHGTTSSAAGSNATFPHRSPRPLRTHPLQHPAVTSGCLCPHAHAVNLVTCQAGQHTLCCCIRPI